MKYREINSKKISLEQDITQTNNYRAMETSDTMPIKSHRTADIVAPESPELVDRNETATVNNHDSYSEVAIEHSKEEEHAKVAAESKEIAVTTSPQAKKARNPFSMVKKPPAIQMAASAKPADILNTICKAAAASKSKSNEIMTHKRKQTSIADFVKKVFYDS